MFDKKIVFVIFVYVVDFVWCCGGVIVKYVEMGYDVIVVCLFFGECGESVCFWKEGKFL